MANYRTEAGLSIGDYARTDFGLMRTTLLGDCDRTDLGLFQGASDCRRSLAQSQAGTPCVDSQGQPASSPPDFHFGLKSGYARNVRYVTGRGLTPELAQRPLPLLRGASQ